MKLAIHFKDLQGTGSDRRRIEARIRLALTRFTPLIYGLTATISDENGSRGGMDKVCRLVVRLRAGTVVVNEQAGVVMAAVAQAADRAARAVARAHHRAVDARQSPPRPRGRRRAAPAAHARHGMHDGARVASV